MRIALDDAGISWRSSELYSHTVVADGALAGYGLDLLTVAREPSPARFSPNRIGHPRAQGRP